MPQKFLVGCKAVLPHMCPGPRPRCLKVVSLGTGSLHVWMRILVEISVDLGENGKPMSPQKKQHIESRKMH